MRKGFIGFEKEAFFKYPKLEFGIQDAKEIFVSIPPKESYEQTGTQRWIGKQSAVY